MEKNMGHEWETCFISGGFYRIGGWGPWFEASFNLVFETHGVALWSSNTGNLYARSLGLVISSSSSSGSSK